MLPRFELLLASLASRMSYLDIDSTGIRDDATYDEYDRQILLEPPETEGLNMKLFSYASANMEIMFLALFASYFCYGFIYVIKSICLLKHRSNQFKFATGIFLCFYTGINLLKVLIPIYQMNVITTDPESVVPFVFYGLAISNAFLLSQFFLARIIWKTRNSFLKWPAVILGVIHIPLFLAVVPLPAIMKNLNFNFDVFICLMFILVLLSAMSLFYAFIEVRNNGVSLELFHLGLVLTVIIAHAYHDLHFAFSQSYETTLKVYSLEMYSFWMSCAIGPRVIYAILSRWVGERYQRRRYGNRPQEE